MLSSPWLLWLLVASAAVLHNHIRVWLVLGDAHAEAKVRVPAVVWANQAGLVDSTNNPPGADSVRDVGSHAADPYDGPLE